MDSASITLSDLEQFALQALEARYGSIDDDSLIVDIISAKVHGLSDSDLLALASGEATFLNRETDESKAEEGTTERIRRNCAEYLAAVLYLKAEGLASGSAPEAI